MLVAQLCLTLCNPIDCSQSDFSVHGFPRREYLSGFSFSSSVDLPDPEIEPMFPALQADSLTTDPPGKFLEERGF